MIFISTFIPVALMDNVIDSLPLLHNHLIFILDRGWLLVGVLWFSSVACPTHNEDAQQSIEGDANKQVEKLNLDSILSIRSSMSYVFALDSRVVGYLSFWLENDEIDRVEKALDRE